MKTLTCIVCPNSCKMEAEIDADGNLKLKGNKCERGRSFAFNELTNPMRTLTTTVKTSFSQKPFLPVRTEGEIKKRDIPSVMETLKDFVLDKPVSCGDIIIENIDNTGCNIIATSSIC